MSALVWKIWGILFAFLSVGVALYAIGVYLATLGGAMQIGAIAVPLAPSLRQKPVAIYLHATVSGIALALCGLQMLPAFRAWTSYRTHRWLGRLYAVCVCIGASAALVLSTTAVGGTTSTAAFASLAVLWLLTTGGGVYAARTHRHRLHERLMSHSAALCFAAVTLRLYLPIALSIGGAGTGFAKPYSVIAWACWVPNVLVVEAYYWLFQGAEAPMTLPTQSRKGVVDSSSASIASTLLEGTVGTPAIGGQPQPQPLVVEWKAAGSELPSTPAAATVELRAG